MHEGRKIPRARKETQHDDRARVRSVLEGVVITASFVRRLIEEKAHTQVSAAKAIGISPRSMRRYVSNGKDFRPASVVVCLALKGLPTRTGPPPLDPWRLRPSLRKLARAAARHR